MDFTHFDVTAFITLTFMEIILGIDNVIFISILVDKIPAASRETTRRIGLGLALVMRLGLLACVSFLQALEKFELFKVPGLYDPSIAHEPGHPIEGIVTGKGLVLLVGGLFLIGKSSHEIYDKLEGDHSDEQVGGESSVSKGFGMIVLQIIALDIVFSVDSILTAVGMTKDFLSMAGATVISTIVMIAFSGKVGDFISKHPSMKLLALSFLIMIGMMLVAEGSGAHVPKGYVYSSMAFAVFVEMLNMKFRKKQKPVTLHTRYEGNLPPKQAA